MVETYFFSYQKLFNAFANVMGIMEAIKFCLMVVNLLFNFSFQNLNFLDFFYSRKIRIYNKHLPTNKLAQEELGKSEMPSLTVIPFKDSTGMTETIRRMNVSNPNTTKSNPTTTKIEISSIVNKNKKSMEISQMNSDSSIILFY